MSTPDPELGELPELAYLPERSGERAHRLGTGVLAAACAWVGGDPDQLLLDQERLPGSSRFSLSEMTIEARVTGPVALVQVTQSYWNPYSKPVDVVYLFPLPGGACVHEFGIGVEDQRVEACVQERPDGASEDALLEARVGGVGGLPPGPVRIQFTYAVWLPMSQAGTTLRVPLASRSCARRPEIRATVDLEAGGRVLDSVACSQPAELCWGPGCVRLSLEDGRQLSNRDLIVRFGAQAAQRAVLFAAPEHFVLSVTPPAVFEEAWRPRDIVFLLDRSQSMEGPRLDCACRAVLDLLSWLGPEDRFCVLAFNDRLQAFDGGGAPWHGLDRARALAPWLWGLEARGGCPMATALGTALTLPGEPGRQLSCLLVTDGEVDDEPEVSRVVRGSSPQARLFTLGIGRSRRAFLEQLAELGRGQSELVGRRGVLGKPALERLVRATGTAAVMTDLRLIDRGLGFLPESLMPDRIPNLLSARPIVVAGQRLHPQTPLLRGVEVTGKLWGVADWSVTLEPQPTRNPALGILWARARKRGYL